MKLEKLQRCFWVAYAVIALVMVCAFAQGERPKYNPIRWNVLPVASAGSLKQGENFEVQIIAEIQDEWHLYSTKEIALGPRPTRISLATEQPFNLAGIIGAPKPLTAFDHNFNTDVEFYEKAVTFTVPITVASNASSGKQTLLVQVRYQACMAGLCLPPKIVKLEVPVEIAEKQ